MQRERMVDSLSRRERQIMDILYRQGRATAAEVREQIPNPPSYSSIRALLRILERKGHLLHEEKGAKYIYLPATPRIQARTSALRRVVETFFDNSIEQAVMALLDLNEKRDSSTLKQLRNMLSEVEKKKG